MKTVDDMRDLVFGVLESRFKTAGVQSHNDIDDTYDMVESGIIDSLGFVNLIVELESRLGVSIDIVDLPTDEVSNFSAMCRFLHERISQESKQ